MSTLKVATLQDLSAANSSTPEQIAQGRAKAWVNFNGTGTVAIRDDYNVSSITDHTTGSYSINFDTAMSNANYATTGMVLFGTIGNKGTVELDETTAQTTALVRIRTWTSVSADCTFVCIAIFGD